MRRRGIAAAVGVALMAAGAWLGVGARGVAAQDKVTFRMNWYWGGIHAPFALAKERGYFEKAGVNVEIAEGRGSATTVQLVGNKSDTFGWADGVTLTQNAVKGVPVKAVATILNVLPDVDRFNWANYVAEGFNIDPTDLGLTALVLAGYLLPWGVLAYYLMKSREVAA